MPLLKAEAEKLSNDTLVSGVIEELIERNDMLAVLPFVGVNSKAYVYDREFVGTDDNLTNGAGMPAFVDPVTDTIVEGGAKFVQIVTKLRVLAGDVDVDKFLQETMGDTNDQLSVQVAAKAKSIARQFSLASMQGDSTANAKSFDGVGKLVTSAQTIDAAATSTAGAAITLGMLDQLADQVPNGANAYVMRKGTLRAVRALLRAAGGNGAVDIMIENFGRPMPSHNGIPIIVSDHLPTEQFGTGGAGTSCSVYAARFNEADGLHGLYGGKAAGVRVEEIGTVQNKDADRIRVKWYCGMALKSTQSLARLRGVTNL